ncbi:MAG: SPOR domain-containing protein [Deltaproteobacteria bacterium]|nr:SPOR domain-containing protein [Deltaproteobacteria bacterium]
MYYYFLFRKIVFSLLVLVGIGVIILSIRFYWGGPEEQTVTNIPLQSPPAPETGDPAPLPEKKPDFLKTEDPAEKIETKSPETAEDSGKQLSAPSTTAESKPKVPPPALERKPVSPAPMADVKTSLPSPPKEVKKETQLKEQKKETKPKELAQKNKAAPPDSNKSESGNDIQQPDQRMATIKAKDSIYAIAEKTYRVSNTSIVDRILELNPKITNPDLLPANLKIRLPEITEESLIIPSSEASVMIRLGTFMKPEYAYFLKGHPAIQGKEINIIPWTTPSGQTFYRATAGKFESREEGLQVIRELKEKGLSPYFEGFKKKN